MEQEYIHKAIGIADQLLENEDLSKEDRSKIETLRSELQGGISGKTINAARYKRIVTEIFEWFILLRPFLKDIIEIWI